MTHYCLVRSDLPHGVQAAQLIHAAGYSVREKIPEGTFSVALAVNTETQLRKLSRRLTKAGIDHNLIVEEDEPYRGQAMALGIPPTIDRSALRPFLSKYALVAQLA